MKRKPRTLRASKAELDYIKEIKLRSVEERLAAGELEIVPDEEIPGVLRRLMSTGRRGVWTELPNRDMSRLQSLSKRAGKSPGELLAQWARERLQKSDAAGH